MHMDRSQRQKINKETLALNDTSYQVGVYVCLSLSKTFH